MKNRFKTYAFWIALSSAVVVLVQSLGKLFGFEIESSVIENVIMSVCGVLIVLGIVSNNESDDFDDIDSSDDKDELQNKTDASNDEKSSENDNKQP